MIRTAIFLVCFVLCPAMFAVAAPIHDAITNGDFEMVKTLITAEPSLVSAPDAALNLPLHLAALTGQVEIIEYLIAHGAEVDAGDRENTRPLGCAALRGHYDAAVALINHGASLDKPDDFGVTPLLHAFQGGNVPLVRYLIDRGASLETRPNDGSTVLHWAARGGNLELVQLCLDRDVDIASTDRNGYTPLHWAAWRNRSEAIRVLAARGCPLESRSNDNGLTPLAATAVAGALEAAQALLEAGADVNYRTDRGQTLLQLSAERGRIATAALWVERGVAIEALDHWGGTALNYSARSQPEMTRWLLARGANPNIGADSATAPLYFAVSGGDTATVAALLGAGANRNSCGRDSDPPLHVAVRRDRIGIAGMLLDSGADPNKGEPIYSQTPLHIAARDGKSAVAALLLDRGANIEAEDDLGHAPLYYATRYGHPTCVELLRKRGARPVGLDQASGAPAELTDSPKPGSAVVWYLGHSGWAIRTANHFLIFDYQEIMGHPDVRSLRNGFIDPAEIADLPVTVFSTHEHTDHYDPVIFGWREQVKSIDYILGHQPRDQHGYTYIEPRQTQEISGVRVTTIHSTDAGVGYLVEVDGLTIYDAGDHSAGTVDLPEEFRSEIDFLAERRPQVDMAFMPISGCSLGTPESVQEGYIYTLGKLHPKVSFPQHSMNAEHRYVEFKETAAQRDLTDSIVCATFRGDMFTYGGDGNI